MFLSRQDFSDLVSAGLVVIQEWAAGQAAVTRPDPFGPFDELFDRPVAEALGRIDEPGVGHALGALVSKLLASHHALSSGGRRKAVE